VSTGTVLDRPTAGEIVVAKVLKRQRADRRWSRLTLIVGVSIVVVVVGLTLLRPFLGLPGPNVQNYSSTFASPSWAHLFGTDDVGRDVFSRTLAGLSLDMQVTVEVTGIAFVIGVTLGALAGFFGGFLDAIIMRLADIVLAFPFMVLIIAIIAAFGPGLKGVYVGVPTVGWAIYARFTRGEMLSIRERDFISAAKTLGYSRWRILLKHALPHTLRPAVVYVTIDAVLNIVLIATLSFLGLGVQPPTAELGAIISEGQEYFLTAWWISTLPGLVLVVLGVGVALLGDGLAGLLGEGEPAWLK
jgi:peptide/nickel transport system permease protein